MPGQINGKDLTLPWSKMKGEWLASSGPPRIQGTKKTVKMDYTRGSQRKLNADFLADRRSWDAEWRQLEVAHMATSSDGWSRAGRRASQATVITRQMDWHSQDWLICWILICLFPVYTEHMCICDLCVAGEFQYIVCGLPNILLPLPLLLKQRVGSLFVCFRRSSRQGNLVFLFTGSTLWEECGLKRKRCPQANSWASGQGAVL